MLMRSSLATGYSIVRCCVDGGFHNSARHRSSQIDDNGGLDRRRRRMRWLLDTRHVQIGEADVGGGTEALPRQRRDSLVHAIRRLAGLARLSIMWLDLRRIGRQRRENDLGDTGRNIRDRRLDANNKDAMR